jgi:tripartite-type tricarboxylate transporter receptor subunit TctC
MSKANPSKISMASGGNGTTPHVAGELFKMMTGIDMVHVPYRGAGPAITDLLSGQVQVLFAGTPESMEHIRAGRLRPLAVTDTTRLEALPDIPTVREFVPGYEAISFTGVGVPKNTFPPRSLTSSTERSMQPSPIPRSVLALPIWAAPHLRTRPQSSRGSWPTRRRSGAR